ncbi:MAG: 3-hydroxyacyl-ACP dehydratase FabZ [Nitrospinota bacterium]|nr:3-hydroxyacyl-ACP dehydratase FabZ [Nitrospinota bacterium]
MEDILRAIPHRPPFLFLDRITESGSNFLKAEKELKPELDFFKGHYPSFPIMPGVLICEAIFQAGAILLSKLVEAGSDKVPVLTRIKNARFKRMVRPGDILNVHTEIIEKLGEVFFMRGKALVGGKTAVDVEYACTLAMMEGANE